MEWISIEDRIPDDMAHVLVWCPWDGWHVRIYHNGEWFNEIGNSTMKLSGEQEKITHWISLPEPPN
jgi:hypothetical protein